MSFYLKNNGAVDPVQSLEEQLSRDYCCTLSEVRDSHNHFSVNTFPAGQRAFRRMDECAVKLAIYKGKFLICGEEELTRCCERAFGSAGAAWFFEPENLRKFDVLLGTFGQRIRTLHPFFLPNTGVPGGEKPSGLHWYEREELERFREDERFTNALTFDDGAPDLFAVTEEKDGELLGMAGVSRDAENFWQIGIDVVEKARGQGIAVRLVTALKDEILRRGACPFYGTSASHLASQRVALASGFTPAWLELLSEPAILH